MGFKITAIICGSEFSAKAETIAEAYERVRSILNNRGDDDFNILSEYMCILCNMSGHELASHENSFLRIEKL